MMGNPTRRTFAAYVAGITVLAGLMYVVALGGNSFTVVDSSRAQLGSMSR